MTYRERRIRRAERLQQWAAGRREKSSAAFTSAKTIANGIPFGQPILVGHHSEARHRRAVERIDNGMRRGVEHERKADSMESRAANILSAADRAIYSDDQDAIEQLRARIDTLEAERARVKVVNTLIRRKGLRAALPELTEGEKKELLDIMRVCPWHGVEKRGFPSYHLQNLGGNINRQKKRLEQLGAASDTQE